MNEIRELQSKVLHLYKNTLEMKAKYIKRTGSPGNYKYWYYDKKTGSLKPGSATKKEVQGKEGRKKKIEKAIKDAFNSHSEEDRNKIEDVTKKFDKGEHSKSLHTDKEGNYNKERLKLHEKIISNDKFNNEKAVGGKKLFIFAGTPASGKTSALKKYIKGEEFVDLNADDIKEFLDYNGEKFNGYNAALVHNESSDILKKLVDKHKDLGSNILIDQTMRDRNKTEKFIEKFKDAGYEVHLMASFVEPHTAIERAKNRFNNTKRYVPYDFISGIGDDIKSNAFYFRDKVDTHTFVDNEGDLMKGAKPYKIS